MTHRAFFRGSGADLDGEYRYTLWRRWGDHAPSLLWVMLNPSTADALADDPTIRKCCGFARRWGYGGILVVNLFALRSTDPRGLWKHQDPVGPLNDKVIAEAARACHDAVCAWGSPKTLTCTRRALAARRILIENGGVPTHLGITKDGHPRHPLYLPYSTSRCRWDGASA